MADDFMLSPEDVSEIVAILSGSGYERLDISTTRFRLRVAREGEGWSQDWNWTTAGQPTVATEAVAVTADMANDSGLSIRASLPGTFYHAPQPGAAPFVEIGAVVEVDTVVGIIETMKLMTPVHAGVAGILDAILIENATMVDSGAVLMQLRALA
jgi:acetyl-CoA carboxylase biotin carboxyl carrier protein